MLNGSHIVITRPREHADPLTNELKARGAIPILYPGFTFASCDNILLLDAVLAKAAAGHFDTVILTSGQAAQVMSERLAHLELALVGQIVWTVGAHTAAACQFEGSHIHTPAQARDTAALLEALPDIQGKHILLPQSPLAAPTLLEGLKARGAEVTVVHPYSIIPGKGGDNVPNLLRRHVISAFTFFSGSAVEGVVARLESSGVTTADLHTLPSVCFGATAAISARTIGLNVWEGDATYDTFYALLEEACQETSG